MIATPANSKQKYCIHIVLLALVPLLFFGAARNLDKSRGPLWLALNLDPSYPYLFSSLLIANHYTPSLIGHPGTTTQILGAVILKAEHVFTGLSRTNVQVLTDPESTLSHIIVAITTATAFALFVLPIAIWRRTQDISLALLFQVTLLFFDQTYFNIVFFRPELCFPLLCLPLSYLLLSLNDDAGGALVALAAGALAGACLMNKWTFCPFVALGFIVIRSRKLQAAYFLGFATALCILVLVIRTEVSRAVTFITNLLTHSGFYGEGPKELIDTATYYPGLLTLLHSDSTYIILILTGLFLPALSLLKLSLRDAIKHPTSRSLFGLGVLELLSFAVTAKYPTPHYLMPLVALAPLHVLLCAKLLYWHFFSFPGIASRGVIIGIVLVGLYHGYSRYSYYVADFRKAAAEQLNEYNALKLEKKKTGDMAVYYYRSSSPEYGLSFGNEAGSRYEFAQLLSTLYPNAWFFDISNVRFQSYGLNLSPEKFYTKHGRLLFLGSGYIENTLPHGQKFPLPEGGKLTRLWSDPYGIIDELTW